MRDLDRFVFAQAGGVFEQALAQLQAGAKTGHWMWFIFPQIAGLGHSETARYYAIADRAEAEAYLAHPILAPRLNAATDAMLDWAGDRTAIAILGCVDALKFRSSMTLFAHVGAAGHRFGDALAAFSPGPDPATLQRM